MLVAVLEPEQARPDGHQGGEIVGRENFALDDREVDLDLVEPTGMDGGVHQDERRPSGLQPRCGLLAAMGRAVVHDPEHAPGRPVGRLAHDLGHQALEGDNAIFRLAAAEEFGPMHVPGRQVRPGPSPGILVFDVHGAARPGRPRGMPSSPGLDTRLLVGTDDILSRPQRLPRPAPLVEVQDAARLRGKIWIAGEEPTPVPPRAERILAEPPPQCRAADLRDQPVGDHLPPQLGERPAGQRDPTAGRQLTGEGFDLDDDAGGKSGLAARLGALPPGRVIARGRTACATY